MTVLEGCKRQTEREEVEGEGVCVDNFHYKCLVTEEREEDVCSQFLHLSLTMGVREKDRSCLFFHLHSSSFSSFEIYMSTYYHHPPPTISPNATKHPGKRERLSRERMRIAIECDDRLMRKIQRRGRGHDNQHDT